MKRPPGSTRRSAAIALAAALVSALAVAASGCATVEPPWPDTVVGIESMRLRQKPRMSAWLLDPVKGAHSTAVLHLHVDAEGRVARVRVDQSSGTGRLDDAALAWARGLRFEPFASGGAAVPVTLVLPLRLPRDRH